MDAKQQVAQLIKEAKENAAIEILTMLLEELDRADFEKAEAVIHNWIKEQKK